MLSQIVEFLAKNNEIKTALILLNTFEKYAQDPEHFEELAMWYRWLNAPFHSISVLNTLAPHLTDIPSKVALSANFAELFNVVNKPDTALFHVEKVLEINPNNLDVLSAKAFAHTLKGEDKEAMDIYLELSAKKYLPDMVKDRVAYHLAMYTLDSDRSAYQNMIQYGRRTGIFAANCPEPYINWNGRETKKTILVFPENNLIDTLVGWRFLADLTLKNIDFLFVCNDPDLFKLAKRHNISVVASGEHFIKDPHYYYATRCLNLPFLLNLDPHELWSGPYLQADPEKVSEWAEKLPQEFIVVRCHADKIKDFHRDLPCANFISMIQRTHGDIPVVILPLGVTPDKQEETSVFNSDNLHGYTTFIKPETKSLEDVMAVLSLAQHTYGACSYPIHLAGAMGLPCTVYPLKNKYFTWRGVKDGRSAWYGENLKVEG